MGRGRAKAKQTKVARELKYRNYDTDFSELQRELHGDDGMHEGHDTVDESSDSDDGVDPYDPYADLYDEDSASSR